MPARVASRIWWFGIRPRDSNELLKKIWNKKQTTKNPLMRKKEEVENLISK
jgi:hypothetical protein